MLALRRVGLLVFVLMLLAAVWTQATQAQETTETVAPLETVEVLPAPDVPPVVVVEPSRSPVSYETILLFIGAVIAGLLWLADRANKRMERSVPVELALILGDALVKLTPTTTDDELLARLKLLFTPEVEKTVDKAVHDATEAVG